MRLIAGFALALAIGVPAAAQSPWPSQQRDPSLVETIRAAGEARMALSPYDLIFIPPATEPAARAAWLADRYQFWLLEAELSSRIFLGLVERTQNLGNSPDPHVREAVRQGVALASDFENLPPLAREARSLVLAAEQVRLENIAGRASVAEVATAAARRDIAESQFHTLNLRSGVESLAVDVRSMALYEVSRQERYADQVANLESLRTQVREARQPAARANAELRLSQAESLLPLQRQTLEANRKLGEARTLERVATHLATGEGLAYRLVRDAVQGGAMPAAALDAATLRLTVAQEAMWDAREVAYIAEVDARVAQQAEQQQRDNNRRRQQEERERLAASRPGLLPASRELPPMPVLWVRQPVRPEVLPRLPGAGLPVFALPGGAEPALHPLR